MSRRKQTIPPEARERLQRILGQLTSAKARADKMIAEDASLGEDVYPFKCGAYGATIEIAAEELAQVLEGFAPRPRVKKGASE